MRSAGSSHLLLGFVLVAAASQSVAETIRFTGEARSLKNDRLLYTEHHRQSGSCDGSDWIPEQGEVTYRNPDDKVIAEKTIDYGQAPERPGFTLEDLRFKERIEVRNRDDRKASVDWRTTDGDEERLEASIPDNGVIDAGFEVMVRMHWEALVEDGESIEIQYFAPTRGKFYGFEAEYAENEALDADHVFRITPGGWVSGWFVDDIYLGYNDKRELTDFHGLTNILKDPDDNHTAHIHYSYQESPGCN